MRSNAHLSLPVTLLVALTTACGARTHTLDERDGSVLPRVDLGVDAGRRDLGPPPIDFGPPGCRSDAECSDGLACNGLERCGRGACVAGTPQLCDDAIACTEDVCIELGGDSSECVSTPSAARCPAGELCTPAGCARVGCLRDPDCDDRIACNGAETCSSTGVCVSGAPVDCNDGDICTTDHCVEGFGCRWTPRDDDGDGAINMACGGTDCNDGNPNIRPGLTELCEDGIDNDCSGAADCRDPTCATRPPCVAPPPWDGGAIDIGVGTHEIGIAACTNGVDDDSDGRTDCADSDCNGFGPGGECCNGIDDTPGNADTQYDLFACRCFSDADCVGVGSVETSCWLRSYSLCGPRCNFLGGDRFCHEAFPGTMDRCDIPTGECVPL
jgi:hypothetical protein